MPVNPKLISWACKRSGYPFEKIESKFKHLSDWISGKSQPTWKQFHDFARMVHVPFGYLFFDEPPVETIPFSDFRTLDSKHINQPSPNLLDTIDLCQIRQDWYRNYVIAERAKNIEFIGTENLESNPELIASKIRHLLEYESIIRRNLASKDALVRLLTHRLEEIGILVMISGTVGNNPHRKLDLNEFRGFTLCDAYAPVIFINGSDSKAAQLFTLCHELAHLTLGNSGITNVGLATPQKLRKQEQWCNAVAAEILVPQAELKKHHNPNNTISSEVKRLSLFFKVSNLVILRRLLDVNILAREQFEKLWGREMSRVNQLQKNSRGGNYYSILLNRVGKKFARAVISSTQNGKTLYTDAFELLGISNTSAFNKLAKWVES